jgi:glycosyltransferase involved in cell wall biosynthesis
VASLAIVHEWLQARAGSEQVFETLAKAYPGADLYALTRNPEARYDLERPVTTTFLDTAVLRDRRALTLPLMPIAWRLKGKARYDAVISSHHAFAKSNRLAKGDNQLCYAYAPARYVWTPEIDNRGAGPIMKPARAVLKAVDLRSVRRVRAVAAISSSVAKRIERCWRVGAEVIHPPVNLDRLLAGDVVSKGEYLLGVGRWVPYKNLHLLPEVGSLLGMPVKIAGWGPEQGRIRNAAAQATVPVEVYESPSDEELAELYRGAAALLFPTYEDFGIVPVEAQAAGTPVVAPRIGGVVDTVVDGVSGVLVDSMAAEEFADGIRAALALPRAVDACRDSARRFTRDRFIEGFTDWTRRNEFPEPTIEANC